MSDLPRLSDAPHYQTVRTLLIDADDNTRQLAWIDGAIWPPKGSAIELHDPNRDGTVAGTRLSLAPDGSATVFVYVRDADAGHFEPHDAGA